MNREFHIFTSNFDTCFVMKGTGKGYPKKFQSLFEATRHARTQPDSKDGMVVIHDESRRVVNSIPLSLRA
jgi:hypothetical protein